MKPLVLGHAMLSSFQVGQLSHSAPTVDDAVDDAQFDGVCVAAVTLRKFAVLTFKQENSYIKPWGISH